MKKVISIVLAMIMLFTVTISVLAQGENNQDDHIKVRANASICKAEELLGVNFDRTNITTDNVCLANRDYIEMTDKNDIKITVDQGGNIVRINTIYAKNNENNLTQKKKVDSTAIEEHITDLFSLDQDYEMSPLEEYGDYCGYSYIKHYSNGLQNPFESVKIACDATTGEVVIATKFDYEPNSVTAQIDANEAINAAEASEYYSEGSTVVSCGLTFILPSMYLNDKMAQYSDNEVVLCYKIVYDNECVIYVDAMTAEPVAVDAIMAYNSASFIIEEVSESLHPTAYNRRPSTAAACEEYNEYRLDNLELSEEGFEQLGYNAVPQNNPYDDSTINNSVENFLNGSSSYGFYFCGHANSNVLAFKYNTILRRENVSGNWKFVFLDGCETAVDTGWAEQFNIYGYSGRAYLGWFDTVLLVNTHQFQEYFWPRVGTKAIQALAVDAANAVPGSGTTPIRFWGDANYTGIVS